MIISNWLYTLKVQSPPFNSSNPQSIYLYSMHLYLALISCLVSTAHCWQFDGGGGRGRGGGDAGDASVVAPQRQLRTTRNTARALARGPPPVRGSAALLGSQQQDVLYACPLNSMCQCAGLPNETSTLIEINCNEVALYKFPGKLSAQQMLPFVIGQRTLRHSPTFSDILRHSLAFSPAAVNISSCAEGAGAGQLVLFYLCDKYFCLVVL